MSEAASHTHAWIICLNARGLTHPQIHPYTLINSYRHMQAYAHAHSLIHIYYTHILLYSNCIILLFLFLSQNLLSTCTSLQSRHFQMLCNNLQFCTFDTVNRVVDKIWINVLHHLVDKGILGNYYPDIFSENCFSGLSFWFVV